ncbi:hypothetical protein RQP46_002143 [Phenoliferia psychrophenolica]
MTDRRPFRARLLTNQYLIGAIGGGLFGLDISSMSSQLSNPYYLKQFHHPNSGLQGGITASMPAGSFGGSLINTYLADKLGRKYSIIIAGALWIVGSIIQSASYKVRDLVAYASHDLDVDFLQLTCDSKNSGRVISGLSVGIASSVIPIYIAEITKPGVRGRVVALQQALKILADIHGEGESSNEFVQLEWNEIKQAIDFDRTQAAHSYLDLLKPGIFRRVWLGVSLQMWSQLCGMNVMMYYVVYVFQSAGITGRRGGLIASSVQWVLNVALTVPAIIYIDKWGRRPMLLIGAFFMTFFLMLVGGLMGHYGHNDPTVNADETTTWVITGHGPATRAIICCSCQYISLILLVRPTHSRTLEEMEVIFNSGHHFTAWRLGSDVGKQTLADVIGHTEKGSVGAHSHEEEKEKPSTPTEEIKPTV